jgi:N-methylhydantoinase B
MLNTYGVNGGRPGATYGISVSGSDGEPREVAGMADNIEVEAGSLVRIVTTGGGGWGDPLEREPDRVCYDVACGLVSAAAARLEYGVVLNEAGGAYELDTEETGKLRAERRLQRPDLPMFDRGPYFEEKKKAGEISWPEGWSDPDAGWTAVETPASGKSERAA